MTREAFGPLVDELIKGVNADLNEIFAAQVNDYYELKYRCLNCGFNGGAKIKKGRPVSHFPCPYCGCCAKDL